MLNMTVIALAVSYQMVVDCIILCTEYNTWLHMHFYGPATTLSVQQSLTLILHSFILPQTEIQNFSEVLHRFSLFLVCESNMISCRSSLLLVSLN